MSDLLSDLLLCLREVSAMSNPSKCFSSSGVEVLHGAAQRGLLGPEALGFCGASQLQAAPAQAG